MRKNTGRRKIILVVDEDPMVHRFFRQSLAESDYGLVSGRRAVDAATALKGLPIQTVVAAAELTTDRGTPLLCWVIEHYPSVRVVGVAASDHIVGTAADLIQIGVPVVPRPIDIDRLLRLAVEQSDQGPFSGTVAGVELMDIIQLLMLAGNNVRLDVQSHSGEVAALHFREGQVRHAVCGEKEGEEAFNHCVTFKGGRFNTSPGHRLERVTIDKPGNMLLLDAAQAMDECHRDASIQIHVA